MPSSISARIKHSGLISSRRAATASGEQDPQKGPQKSRLALAPVLQAATHGKEYRHRGLQEEPELHWAGGPA